MGAMKALQGMTPWESMNNQRDVSYSYAITGEKQTCSPGHLDLITTYGFSMGEKHRRMKDGC